MSARPDLALLETLLGVAEHGSIGAAARVLGLRQPSVTDRLKRLERQLQLSLLERSPRGTRLTAEGNAVADWAREVLAASDRLDAGCAALRREHDSELRVSASMTISEYLVPRWLIDLREASPGLSVSLRVGNSQQVADDVLRGTADIGFVEGLKVPRGLAQRVFGSDRLVVVVGSGHPWSRRSAITAAELAATPLIMREPGSGTRETLAHALGAAGHTAVPPKLELGSTAAVKAAVLTSQGATVFSLLAASDDVSTGRLCIVALEDLELRRRLRVVWRKGTSLRGPAAHLAHRAVAGEVRTGESTGAD
ncbi:LysR family transcriptional regulator [Nocardioides sp. LHG3406-4]|uniref:LysR family transcriptional regulator n=1 Tax=Nocardioides sp. LHG3406-4 TaxID=2804575 RepID=UPI003CFAF3FC